MKQLSKPTLSMIIMKEESSMKRTFIALAALFFMVGLATSAMAFSVTVSSGGESFNVGCVECEEGFTIPSQTITFSTGDQVTMSGMATADPSLTYGIAVVDFGAPSVFGFAFSTPIVDLPALTVVSASIVGGLTDFTGDGVKLTAANASGYVQDCSLLGVSPIWSVGDSADFGPGPAGSLYTYGAYNFGPAAGPPGPFISPILTATTTFSMTGGGDVAALTGYCSIDPAPIPLPPTLLLLGSGLLGLAGLRMRQGRV
jgi:hypothetical protein